MNKLNELMKKRGLTNEVLSGFTQVSVNVISKMRNEDINCTLSTICKLCDFFSVSIDEFLGKKTEFQLEEFVDYIRRYFSNGKY